ncbi:MAG TPA: hypothetical protein VK427_25935, partial [Kofleriaceae bacterium]|nr:hypothetical protein [Kofleriaceae bacterium]
HPKGVVDRIDVRTPGLSAGRAAAVERCVRATLADLAFPARRLGTTAVLPYVYQRTAAPGAGPQRSCRDASGCRVSSGVVARRAPRR